MTSYRAEPREIGNCQPALWCDGHNSMLLGPSWGPGAPSLCPVAPQDASAFTHGGHLYKPSHEGATSPAKPIAPETHTRQALIPQAPGQLDRPLMQYPLRAPWEDQSPLHR